MWIKNILLGLLALICVALITVLVILGVANSGVGARELDENDMMLDWMSHLDDKTPLNEVFIPGTHDSGALYSFLGVSGKCQSYTIGEQLSMGVRFFDIRLQLRGSELAVVHSFVDQKLTFDAVLDDIKAFITENPSEFVIISIKEDADADAPELPFEKAVENALSEHLGSLLSTSAEVPSSVGEARGKVHIVSRYSGASIGVPAHSGWADSTSFELGSLYVQDYYAIDGVEAKMGDIKNAFLVSSEKKHALVLNFTSCYLSDGFPPAHAPTTAKLINPQLSEILNSGQAAPCVFVSDFVTPELVRSIIECNFK